MKFIRKYWPILLILALALFLRLYQIESTMTFLEDEGRDMLIVKRMLDTKRPVLIGPQTSTGNMYLGPLYYYIITIPLILSNMNPIGPAIFIALTGVATVYLLYYLARKWFGEIPALASSAMYAVFPMVILFTRNSWNPNLVPFVVALILLTLDTLIIRKENSNKYWLALGLLVGLLVQLHYMALIFVGFLGLAIILSNLATWRKLFPGIPYAFLGFVIMLSPFILFEFRNDFVNTQAIRILLLARENHTIRYTLPIWLFTGRVLENMSTLIGNTLSRSFFVTDSLKLTLTYIFCALSALILLLQYKTKKLFSPTLLILFLLFGPLIALGIYQENIHPHYLSFLFPLVPLVFAAGFYYKYSRFLAYIFAIFVVAWVLPTTVSYISSGPTLQSDRAANIAEYINGQINQEPYNLVSNSITNTTPYQYYAYI